MILDTTYMPKDMVAMIDEKLGKSFSFIERIRMGGTGSHRMIIEEHSRTFEAILSRNNSTNYCSIELRPKGIIIHIHKRLNSYSWLVPYHHMSIFKSNLFSIHAAGEFLKLRLDNNYEMNRKLLDKVIGRKNEVTQPGLMRL